MKRAKTKAVTADWGPSYEWRKLQCTECAWVWLQEINVWYGVSFKPLSGTQHWWFVDFGALMCPSCYAHSPELARKKEPCGRQFELAFDEVSA